jgi:D-alanyl-D-alanine carboxypeptidase
VLGNADISQVYSRRTAIGLLAQVLGGVSLAACTAPTANGSPPATSALQQRIEQLQAEHQLADVWFRLEAPGRAPMEVSTSGNADVILPVASISKSFTAIGIALLIQNGKLRLDSKLGDLLTTYFASRGQTLDASLQNITIVRLLTHRAGLQTNWSSDPQNGLSSGHIIKLAGGGDHDFFNYIIIGNAAKSSGSEEYAYSNLSYLILGMVIEAVSGDKYQDYCEQNIFYPLGIRDATIPAGWRIVSPFAGWHLTMADVLRVWGVFDITAPTLLTADTLNETLLGHLEKPLGNTDDVFYTLGVQVLQKEPNSPYAINHNGIADFMKDEPRYYTFVEKIVPGTAWIIVFSSDYQRIGADVRRTINGEVRSIVKDILVA